MLYALRFSRGLTPRSQLLGSARTELDTRKPTVPWRADGVSPERNADRENCSGVAQLPPRNTRAEPVRHLAFGCIAYDLDVVLETRQPQQPIVIRWLFLRPNAEPTIVGIERF